MEYHVHEIKKIYSDYAPINAKKSVVFHLRNLRLFSSSLNVIYSVNKLKDNFYQ